MPKRWFGLGVVVAAAALIWALNASELASRPGGRPFLLAHRGVYQRYDHAGLKWNDCTATRISKPTNDLLENTMPSIRAALAAGADEVELDVHPTTDNQFVVFHDWGLECRTDGHGVTRDHSLAELKALDVGYGYTADGGRTFPFRGRFKGAMPSLEEVLTAFPNARFLINIKSNDPAEAEQLDRWLTAHPASRPERLRAYGGDRPAARLAELRPGLRPFSEASVKRCALRYVAVGWTGYMPVACRHTTLFLPVNYTWAAWGYPNRLQARFEAAGTEIYLLGPQHGKVGLRGLDTADDLAAVPEGWGMGVLTDAIATTGPLLKQKRRN